jgi:IS1 family transposase
MNRLSAERRIAVIAALVEGASINGVVRMTGVAKNTVLKLLAQVGDACLTYSRATLVNLPCKRVQADEIWSFVGCKEKNVPRDEKGRGRGDVWIWSGICADTKVVPCWHVGHRDAEAAYLFMEDLASRLATRVQLTTDGLHQYLNAVEGVFGWDGVDYAMLVKIYGDGGNHSGRYSQPELVDVKPTVIMGKPDADHISTSFAERQNLTMRTNMRRMQRLTIAHSKKIENHVYAIALYFFHYNFCKTHETLTKARGGIHCTPAMAAGVADRVWKIKDLVALLDRSPENS